MAIQLDLETSQYGTPFVGAYFRIVTVEVGRQRASNGPPFTLGIDVSGYATNTPEEGTREVDFRRYHADLADVESEVGETFLNKCYVWVMDQEDMNGSIPV